MADRRALGDATLSAAPRATVRARRATPSLPAARWTRSRAGSRPRCASPRPRPRPSCAPSMPRPSAVRSTGRCSPRSTSSSRPSGACAARARRARAGRCSSSRDLGEYGLGGDIDDPRDAILAAANYLHARARGESRPCVVRLQPLDRATCARSSASRRGCARDERAFRTYYAWQVYVRTRAAAPRAASPARAADDDAAGAVGRRARAAARAGHPPALRAELDARWEVDPVHFWIVLAAGVSTRALAIAISEAGRRRRDARLLLIGLAFLVSAGFLGLHALATPNVVVDGGSAGFVLATPIGLVAGGRVRRGLGGRVRPRRVAADRRRRPLAARAACSR